MNGLLCVFAFLKITCARERAAGAIGARRPRADRGRAGRRVQLVLLVEHLKV